jgi:uncharacterized membrane protein YqjE
MAEGNADSGTGLFESLKTFSATLIAITHTRLELLSTDLEEEREHLLSVLVLGLLALFCIGVGLVLATIFVVVAFWDSYRLAALGTLAALFVLAGAAAVGFVKHKLRTKPRIFAASLLELSKDRQALSSRT